MSTSDIKPDCGQYFMRGTTFGACSGNGVCVAEPPNKYYPDSVGRCVCNDGWQGRGDMLNTEGMDCNNNILALKIWWIIMAVGYFVCVILTLSAVAKFAREKGISAIFKNDFQMAMFVSGVMSLLRVVESIIRAVTGEVIGENIVVTVFAATAGFIFWSTVVPRFMEAFIKMAANSASMSGSEGKIMAAKLVKMKLHMKVMVVVTAPAYIAIFLSYFILNPKHQVVLIEIYFFGHTVIGAFFVYVVALPVLTYFSGVLNESNKSGSDEKLTALQGKMKVLLREVRNNGGSNFLSTMVFVVCPFLWNYTTYQMCFGWTVAIGLLLAAINLVKPTAKPSGGKVSPGSYVKTTTTRASTASVVEEAK